MIEIPSPSQTYDDSTATLIPASEWPSSTLLIPKSRDWRVRAVIDATLYGDVAIEVVTLTKRRYYSAFAGATYYLWAHNDKPCPIENCCDACNRTGHIDGDPCLSCGGRGWHYAD